MLLDTRETDAQPSLELEEALSSVRLVAMIAWLLEPSACHVHACCHIEAAAALVTEHALAGLQTMLLWHRW